MADVVNFIGESPAFTRMLAKVSVLAPLERPVLILGERGTGKELVAARLNFLSKRWNRPFLTLNCGAMAESLLDSELFGHEAGAFTGAVKRRLSRFEAADGGTLFLDEIGNASLAVQEKLLRVVEYGHFSRVGGNDEVSVNVRILAGTNADLRNSDKFRADLLDRLSFDVIVIPPLRERQGDILLLAQYFAQKMTAELKRELFSGFTVAAQKKLLAHDWPGNVRELRNVVERSVCYCEKPDESVDEILIDPFVGFVSPRQAVERLPSPMPVQEEPVEARDFTAQIEALERRLLQEALNVQKFNQKQAAAQLGLTYAQFRNAVKRLGL